MTDHEPNNDIETRLQAMRPADPSPALRQRIGTSLDEVTVASSGPRPIHRRLLVGLAAAAVILVAGLVVVRVLLNPVEPQIVEDTLPTPQEQQVPEPSKTTPTEPTLFALNNALRESPQEVSDMLDRLAAERFARIASISNPTPVAVPVWGQPITEDLP